MSSHAVWSFWTKGYFKTLRWESYKLPTAPTFHFNGRSHTLECSESKNWKNFRRCCGCFFYMRWVNNLHCRGSLNQFKQNVLRQYCLLQRRADHYTCVTVNCKWMPMSGRSHILYYAWTNGLTLLHAQRHYYLQMLTVATKKLGLQETDSDKTVFTFHRALYKFVQTDFWFYLCPGNIPLVRQTFLCVRKMALFCSVFPD